jgi:PAS domain S-box-containing protein
VPVKAGRRNLGVITLASREPGHFTPERVSLLAAVADSLGTLLENARLVQDLQSSKKEMAMADEVARIVTSTLDIPKVYEKFALEMQKLVDFDRAGIHIVDLRASTLKLAYLPQSTGAIFRQGWTIPLEGTITDHVANTQRSLVLGDLDEEKRFWTVEHRRREGMRSLIMVPLISMEKVVGTFILMSRRRHAYGPREQAIVERLAAQIAPAINNSQLFQEVEQLALALESIGDTVVFHDPEGKIQFVNRAFQEVYGYCPEEVLRKDPMLLLVPGDEANQAIARESLAEGLRAGWRGEVKRLRKNGDEIDVFQTITPVKNKDGEVIGRIAVSRDITENKRVEERLREVARLSSLGELAAGVAHEINNPLTSVLGFSQLLMLEDLPQGVREDLEIVHSEANRAAKIVHNLLSFARRPDPVKMYMDVTLVLDRALEMKTYDFQVGNIEVSRDFSADLPCTMVDAQELIQVVLNILNNAEQAMRCPRGQGRLTVRTTSSKERIKVSISDDGPGIPAEHLARIFEPFFTTKAAGEGTGLGLSISFGIVQQHGGDIWAESIPGEGTTFHIELPITGGEAGGLPPPAGSPQ